MGPRGKILHDAFHTESSEDPPEPQPCREAALPAALPPGIRNKHTQTTGSDSGHGVFSHSVSLCLIVIRLKKPTLSVWHQKLIERLFASYGPEPSN